MLLTSGAPRGMQWTLVVSTVLSFALPAAFAQPNLRASRAVAADGTASHAGKQQQQSELADLARLVGVASAAKDHLKDEIQASKAELAASERQSSNTSAAFKLESSNTSVASKLQSSSRFAASKLQSSNTSAASKLQSSNASDREAQEREEVFSEAVEDDLPGPLQQVSKAAPSKNLATPQVPTSNTAEATKHPAELINASSTRRATTALVKSAASAHMKNWSAAHADIHAGMKELIKEHQSPNSLPLDQDAPESKDAKAEKKAMSAVAARLMPVLSLPGAGNDLRAIATALTAAQKAPIQEVHQKMKVTEKQLHQGDQPPSATVSKGADVLKQWTAAHPISIPIASVSPPKISQGVPSKKAVRPVQVTHNIEAAKAIDAYIHDVQRPVKHALSDDLLSKLDYTAHQLEAAGSDARKLELHNAMQRLQKETSVQAAAMPSESAPLSSVKSPQPETVSEGAHVLQNWAELHEPSSAIVHNPEKHKPFVKSSDVRPDISIANDLKDLRSTVGQDLQSMESVQWHEAMRQVHEENGEQVATLQPSKVQSHAQVVLPETVSKGQQVLAAWSKARKAQYQGSSTPSGLPASVQAVFDAAPPVQAPSYTATDDDVTIDAKPAQPSVHIDVDQLHLQSLEKSTPHLYMHSLNQKVTIASPTVRDQQERSGFVAEASKGADVLAHWSVSHEAPVLETPPIRITPTGISTAKAEEKSGSSGSVAADLKAMRAAERLSRVADLHEQMPDLSDIQHALGQVPGEPKGHQALPPADAVSKGQSVLAHWSQERAAEAQAKADAKVDVQTMEREVTQSLLPPGMKVPVQAPTIEIPASAYALHDAMHALRQDVAATRVDAVVPGQQTRPAASDVSKGDDLLADWEKARAPSKQQPFKDIMKTWFNDATFKPTVTPVHSSQPRAHYRSVADDLRDLEFSEHHQMHLSGSTPPMERHHQMKLPDSTPALEVIAPHSHTPKVHHPMHLSAPNSEMYGINAKAGAQTVEMVSKGSDILKQWSRSQYYPRAP